MEDNFAVVFTQPGVVTIEKQNMPVMKSGQVLIKTSCSLISSGTELTMLCKKNTGNDSIWSKIIRYPIRPGYSNIGQVVDVASDVARSWIGKKVASCSCHSSIGLC
jgi:NADPH:quinone reductase-like Zn-dependent oxidoreductase